jgi:hypothetical protein
MYPTRRDWFRIGGVQLLSAGLMHALSRRADGRSAAPGFGKARACIILFQVGGPYQVETFDPKPDAPAEIRGIYDPTATPVPGTLISAGLPQVAKQAHRFAIIRSVFHTIRCHNPAIYCSLVGREATEPMAISNRTAAKRTDHPHYASVVAKIRPLNPAMPGHVIIPDVTNNGPSKSPGLKAGYLGAAFDPFVLGADPSAADFRFDAAGLPPDIPATRLDDRQNLLSRIDQAQRGLETGGAFDAMATFQQRAMALLTSPRTKQAFDLSQEPAKLRDRYGRHQIGQSTLLARRLVEAGVPFISVFSHTDVDKGSWDTHQKHVERAKNDLMPPADESFATLLDDLHTRGLLDSTLVVWMGEFGRTPKMGVQFSNNTNNATGRDHWCNCYSVVMAGGGVVGGRVIGSSDRFGGYPKERPVHISELAATIFHILGVDPRSQVRDIQGQPHMICDGYPVMELF